MAMRRLILNNFTHSQRLPLQTQACTSQLLHRFSTTTNHHEKPETKEVSVSDSAKKPRSVSPRRRRRRSLWSSEYNNHNLPPSLSGLGNAIVEAATNMNRLLENLSPSRLIRRFKEKDESYTIKFQMPGLSKDDVKITVEDGMLFIRGEHKDEEEGSDDDEFWSAATYGYYNTSLMLPEDAKVEEIKAEMKDGVLHVVIPKDETKKKQIKEVHVG
ncbi:26.5 kDa heat shock protein, mitochondrial [Helianthus annuus]|uniref:Putative HSP20-like chaperones superfamily protein n=1 Tax=Helianthus annuus TaxID=4232 RepID=A0A251UWH3_HELAN|nr:26.5 kDa heat shock protein, mitochondrial [Helianthus annuus]